MNNQHGKYFLTLIYKIFFQKEYPTSDYLILFEPRIQLSENPHYRPDILILKNCEHAKAPIALEKVVLWIEIGNLDYEKAQYVTFTLGKERLKHINYGHPIFNLLEKFDDQLLLSNTESYQDFRVNSLNHEKSLIEEAILKNWSLKVTAIALGMTFRQLRYRIEKYNIPIKK